MNEYKKDVTAWFDDVYAKRYRDMKMDLSITVKDLMEVFAHWRLGADGVTFYKGNEKLFSKKLIGRTVWNKETKNWDEIKPETWEEKIETIDEEVLQMKVDKATETYFPDGTWINIYVE